MTPILRCRWVSWGNEGLGKIQFYAASLQDNTNLTCVCVSAVRPASVNPIRLARGKRWRPGAAKAGYPGSSVESWAFANSSRHSCPFTDSKSPSLVNPGPLILFGNLPVVGLATVINTRTPIMHQALFVYGQGGFTLQ